MFKKNGNFAVFWEKKDELEWILFPQAWLPEDKVVRAQLRDEQQKCGHSRETS